MNNTMQNLDIVEEQVERLYSSISVPVKEIDLNQIKKMVQKRCIENNVQILDKIYGFEDGCPICMNDYTNDSWIVLHPCGHLLCDACLGKINSLAYIQRETRKCPVCRIQAKWIGSTNHNLNTKTTIIPDVSIVSAVPFTYFVQQNNGYGAQGMHVSATTPGILIQSKSPIIEDITPTSESEPKPEIRSEISKQTFEVDGKMETIGNVSIVADELKSTNGIDLLIVFDVSGSMRRVAQEGIKILKYIVDCLDSRDRLSVITFDSNANQLFGLQPMTTNVKSVCKTQIDKCFTAGSTNMENAIELMIRVKNEGMIENRPFKIIILSDGNPDAGKEGTHLINKLYEGDVKPEMYSCTFGDNVRADVMKRFLTEQNLLNYHHIENMNMFETLVSGIGLDKNIIIGKNISIKFKNVKVLSKLAKISNVDPTITEVIFEQIKTSDVFTIPIIFNLDDETENYIEVSYIDNSGKQKELKNLNIDDLGNFVKNNYWYKRIGEQIKDLIVMDNKENKLEILHKIELIATTDNLGDFFQEINSLIMQTKLTISDSLNNTYYNCCTASVLRTYSHASGSTNVVYKSKTNFSDISSKLP